MQGYMYSVFSIVAIAIHLMLNFDLIVGRGTNVMRGTRYSGFLLGILAYYVTDAAWGILAGLGWNDALYVETSFFFLSLVVFGVMWCRFVVGYLGLGKWAACLLSWSGYALLAFNLVALAVNPFNDCFFHVDDQGVYRTGVVRDLAFFLLVAFNFLVAAFVLAKAVRSRDTLRRRCMMAFLFCVTMTVAIVLQVVWPLTPFTALGCLTGNCFFHVFVIQDEQAAKHMEELEKALARAREAEKARSMFFSIVSHDIRTPLNAILGYAELLQCGTSSQAERDETLKSIRASGTTLLQLVNDVLDLAKMDAGKMTLRLSPVRLFRLVDDVFATFRMAASEKGVELVNHTAEVPTVLLDDHRFRQILFNLVGNAVKFTDHGSVTVSAFYTGTNLEVFVSDTGCGIAPDMLTRVLDPFVQVQDPSHAADRAGGTGLGLSICRRLVETMGGELLVESELGRGSTFKAYVPGVSAVEERISPTAAPRPAGAQQPNKLPKHVLVVDDSPVNRAVLSAHLKRAGVTAIDHAVDGVEAFSKLESAVQAGSPYDFVFSDLWMPNMNGFELIEKLRADSRMGGLPVIAVTADTECRRDARAKQFDGILFKPLTYAKLFKPLTYAKLLEAFAAV